jgi:hypothetical protein
LGPHATILTLFGIGASLCSLFMSAVALETVIIKVSGSVKRE